MWHCQRSAPHQMLPFLFKGPRNTTFLQPEKQTGISTSFNYYIPQENFWEGANKNRHSKSPMLTEPSAYFPHSPGYNIPSQLGWRRQQYFAYCYFLSLSSLRGAHTVTPQSWHLAKVPEKQDRRDAKSLPCLLEDCRVCLHVWSFTQE